jgi:hypothetical protein
MNSTQNGYQHENENLLINDTQFLINTFSRGTPREGKGGEKKLVMTGYRGC